MSFARSLLTCLTLALALPAVSHAFSYSLNFDDTQPFSDPFFRVIRPTPAHNAQQNAGKLVLSKDAGSLSTTPIVLESYFRLKGNFSVTVDLQRLAGGGDAGLRVFSETSGRDARMFHQGTTLVGYGTGTGVVQRSASSATIRIYRFGPTIWVEWKQGTNWDAFVIMEGGTDTFGVQLFLTPPGTSPFVSETFDNLLITGDGIDDTRDLSPAQLQIDAAVEISWQSVSGRKYQIQWTNDLTAGPWLNLGGEVEGNGSTKTVFDSTRGRPARFYRLLENY